MEIVAFGEIAQIQILAAQIVVGIGLDHKGAVTVPIQHHQADAADAACFYRREIHLPHITEDQGALLVGPDPPHKPRLKPHSSQGTDGIGRRPTPAARPQDPTGPQFLQQLLEVLLGERGFPPRMQGPSPFAQGGQIIDLVHEVQV